MKKTTGVFIVLSVMLLAIGGAWAQPLPAAKPEQVGMSSARLARIAPALNVQIANGRFPGAVVLVARHGRVVWRKAYGARAVEPRREAMTTNTIFDLASLTKIVATTTSIMILIERGEVRLGDPVVKFIPEMKGDGRDAITIEQLLTHTAGFAYNVWNGECAQYLEKTGTPNILPL